MKEPRAILQTVTVTEDDTNKAVDLRLLPFDCIELTQIYAHGEQDILLTRRQAILVIRAMSLMLGKELTV